MSKKCCGSEILRPNFIFCVINGILQQGRSLCYSFVLSFSLIVSTCLNDCLWIPETYTNQIEHYSVHSLAS